MSEQVWLEAGAVDGEGLPGAATKIQTGVTIWERRRPEKDPDCEVALPSGVKMPPAAHLMHAIDIEDWIREGEVELAEDQEFFQLLVAPTATALIAGGVVGYSAGTQAAGVVAMAMGAFLLVADVVGRFFRVRLHAARRRRLNAYRARLRELTIRRNT